MDLCPLFMVAPLITVRTGLTHGPLLSRRAERVLNCSTQHPIKTDGRNRKGQVRGDLPYEYDPG